MATMAIVTTADTDARQWEDTTFAPSGGTCSACMKPIKALERSRRGEIERQSGTPVTIYRHIDCADPEGGKRRGSGDDPRNAATAPYAGSPAGWWDQYGGALDRASSVVYLPGPTHPPSPLHSDECPNCVPLLGNS